MNNYIYRLLVSLRMIGIVVGCSCIAVIADPKVEIEFFDSATVSDTAIYLGDVADIITEDNLLKHNLSKKMLMKSAPPGHSLAVSAERVVSFHLRNELKNRLLKINNKKRICVRTAGIKKSIQDYNDLIIKYIGNSVAWDPDEWSVEIDHMDDTWESFNAPITANVQGISHKRPRGVQRLSLLITQYGKVKKIPVSCYISVNTKVLIASRNIARGAIIGPDDCELRKSNISRLAVSPYYDIKKAVGQKAMRTINAGTILTDRMLAQLPDVEKGDKLSINISKGNVKISISGIARENGFVGQKIWVQNSATNKLMRVFVIDKSSAYML